MGVDSARPALGMHSKNIKNEASVSLSAAVTQVFITVHAWAIFIILRRSSRMFVIKFFQENSFMYFYKKSQAYNTHKIQRWGTAKQQPVPRNSGVQIFD